MKGLKMRIQSSKVLDDRDAGAGRACPQVMAFSEVYQAMQTGVVDGSENPPSNFYTQKHARGAEIPDADRPRRTSSYAVIVNKKFWDGLPADIRTALEGAMKDATKYANDIAKKENDDALEADASVGQDRDHHAHAAGRRRRGRRRSSRCTRKNEARVGKDIDRGGLQGDGVQALMRAVSPQCIGLRDCAVSAPDCASGAAFAND